ncbi:hypothetical protein SDC9_206787 [bioreactor metagenome]|uniref:Uncharacterized protein n=1 Tax=bioreactor metagenome TaxID=1076179 RepID=A0A645J8P0_9ZZZZ
MRVSINYPKNSKPTIKIEAEFDYDSSLILVYEALKQKIIPLQSALAITDRARKKQEEESKKEAERAKIIILQEAFSNLPPSAFEKLMNGRSQTQVNRDDARIQEHR